MKGVTDKNFGVIIAFLLPGFLLLWGLSFSYNEVAEWLAKPTDYAQTVGGFLYATLASLALGLIISALRWLTIDHLLKFIGIRDPGLRFENLKDKDKYAAFVGTVENHYRYYQYYANTLISVLSAFIIYLMVGTQTPPIAVWIMVGIVLLALFLGARDSLRKYFSRAHAILG